MTRSLKSVNPQFQSASETFYPGVAPAHLKGVPFFIVAATIKPIKFPDGEKVRAVYTVAPAVMDDQGEYIQPLTCPGSDDGYMSLMLHPDDKHGLRRQLVAMFDNSSEPVGPMTLRQMSGGSGAWLFIDLSDQGEQDDGE